MALTLVTSDLIGGLDYSKLTGTVPTWNQNTTGSAATLTTARTIGGVSFNGSAAINLPGVNAAGNQNTSGTAAGLSATLAVGSGGTGVTSITALKNVLDDETWTFANATTFSGKLSVSQSGADMIDLTRSSVGTYRLAISGSDAFSIFDVGANADRLTISSTGNVSVGAATVGHLGVRGLTNDSSAFSFEAANSSGNSILLVRNDGKVGIGTTTMHQNLNLLSSSTSQALINIGTSNSSRFLNIGVASSAGYIMMENAAALNIGTGGTTRLSITSGGGYSFGTPSGVAYGHGSNDGFHLRTGLELGFGNGNNNRPDFGINSTGSGGGASLNIFCGEGSDDIDIQISPNAVMQFNSGGIKFGASGETLDAYEKGTWTPSVYYGSGSAVSISSYVAAYTRIGNLVRIQVSISYVSSSGSGSGAVTIEGFPYNVGAGSSFGDIQGTMRWAGINVGSGYQLLGVPVQGTNRFNIQIMDSAGGYSGAVTENSTSNGWYLYGFECTYMI